MTGTETWLIAPGRDVRDRFTLSDGLEVGAVAATGAGHLAFSAAGASYVFIPLASLGWSAYAYHRWRTEPGFYREVGLGRRGLGAAFRDAGLIAAGSAGLMAGYAAWQGRLGIEPAMAPLLVAYPVWGLVQQFLVQGMVVANLSEVPGWVGSPWVVTPVAAALFGAVHLPNLELTAATFAMGLAFTPVYLKHHNLWPLGLYHGWLGVLFYFWVLDRNPLRKVLPQRNDRRFQAGFMMDAAANPGLRVRVRL